MKNNPPPGSRSRLLLALAAHLFPLWSCAAAAEETEQRPRARELGIIVGELPPGANNAITDVPGVRVGHHTLIEGDAHEEVVKLKVQQEGVRLKVLQFSH